MFEVRKISSETPSLGSFLVLLVESNMIVPVTYDYRNDTCYSDAAEQIPSEISEVYDAVKSYHLS